MTSADVEERSGGTPGPPPNRDRRRQLRAAETRLLYDNAVTGIASTIAIASLLAFAQWVVISRVVVALWWLYMLLVTAGRFVLFRRYRRASPGDDGQESWNAAFVAGVAAATAGWCAATIVLYTSARPINETFLVFVIGGVMLGGASLLAARPEAFLTLLLPTGLLTSLRLVAEGGREHLLMGSLTALFTLATVMTTWRFHRIIASSLQLRFDNVDLIRSLQTAKDQAEAINHELELRVTDRTAKLVEADQRKDEFLATLAHELRNPLAPIRFAVDNLKPESPPATAARARDVINRQVGQLVRLVDDLLDVSRITANKIQLRWEPHDLGRLMATAVETIMPLATAADQRLEVRLPATATRVEGDGARLVQIFANVLSNAVKFTPPGGRIWFTAEQQSTEAVLRIRDSGVGIAPDVLPRVFDMFQQAEPVLERSVGGLGIGLTLARRLVEMHHGRIAISSPGQGQGTEVEIHLPSTSVPVQKTVNGEKSMPGSRRGLRVLIVEDNLDAAEMLELTVSQLGHETRVAHDGIAALAIAPQFAPDVVLLDIGLPVMNGYAVARALRQLPELANVHIAAVTGWGQDEDRRKSREAGFDSHFIKPLTPAMLHDLLATIEHRILTTADTAITPRTGLADSGYSL